MENIEIQGKNRKTSHCARGNPNLAYVSGKEKSSQWKFLSLDSKLVQVHYLYNELLYTRALLKFTVFLTRILPSVEK